MTLENFMHHAAVQATYFHFLRNQEIWLITNHPNDDYPELGNRIEG